MARVVPSDPGDPLLITWILSWVVHALGHHPFRIFEANIAYPLDHTLAFSDHLLGAVPTFAPGYLLTGNPLVGVNVMVILSFALSALGAFCLAHYWTRAFWPSFVAGLLFGFAPYRFGQLSHPQLLNFFWAPVALIFLDRFLRGRRSRDLAAFTACYVVQVLASAYLAFMVTVAVVVHAGYVLATDRELRRRAVLRQALVAAGAAIAILGPVHVPYLLVNRAWLASWAPGSMKIFSASLWSFLTAPPLMSGVYTRVFAFLGGQGAHENQLFPGLVLPALVLVGSVTTIASVPPDTVRRLRRMCWLIVGVALVISLGPYVTVGPLSVPAPYLGLYYVVPGWSGMRVPARWVLLALLGAVPLVALGVVKLGELGRGSGGAGWTVPVLGVALSSLVVAELGTKPFPRAPVPPPGEVPQVYRWLASARPGPIVTVPIEAKDEHHYSYFSTVHWLPTVNGRSGFLPSMHEETKRVLAELPAPRAVEHAAALGVAAVVVHRRVLPPHERLRWDLHDARGGGLARLAMLGDDAVYAIPPVAVTTSLRVAIEAPEQLPLTRIRMLGLLVAPGEERPWRHPSPQGYSRGVARWVNAGDGQAVERALAVPLPLVVERGDVVPVPLRVRSPGRPGRYVLEVSLPLHGVTARSRVVEIVTRGAPTSQDAHGGLAAEYVVESPRGAVRVPRGETLDVMLTAINRGEALWLARVPGVRGTVRLVWQWRQAGFVLPAPSGSVPVRYDVFPGQRYRFRDLVPTPAAPGPYTLELELASEQVVRFARMGTPPVRLDVEVTR